MYFPQYKYMTFMYSYHNKGIIAIDKIDQKKDISFAL